MEARESDPLLHSPNPNAGLDLFASKLTRYVSEVVQFEKSLHSYGTQKDTTEFRKQISAKRDELAHVYKVISNDIRELKAIVPSATKAKFEKMVDQFNLTYKQYQSLLQTSMQNDRVYHPIVVEAQSDPYQQAQQQYIQKHLPHIPPPDQPQQYQAQADGVYADPLSKDIEERNKDFSQVANDLKDLRDMFVDINKLAVEQGVQLNQAHQNTSQANTYVEDGVGELKQAAKYSTSYRKKLLIIVIIVLALLALIGVILYLYIRH